MNSAYDKMAELLFEAGVQRLRRKLASQEKTATKHFPRSDFSDPANPVEVKKGDMGAWLRAADRSIATKKQLRHKEKRTPFRDEEHFADTLADKWKGQQSPNIKKAAKHRRGERHAVTNLLKHIMDKAPDEKAAGEGTKNVYSFLRAGHGMARPDVVAAERERQARRN